MTGGAQGLGLSISRMLAENGAKVVIFDMNSTKGEEASATIQREGYYASFHKVDVSDEVSVASGFESVSKEHGRLDIAVNCAGIVGPHGVTTEQVDVKDFDLVYAGGNIKKCKGGVLIIGSIDYALFDERVPLPIPACVQ